MAGLFDSKKLEEKRHLLSDILTLKIGIGLVGQISEEEKECGKKANSSYDKYNPYQDEISKVRNTANSYLEKYNEGASYVSVKAYKPRPWRYMTSDNDWAPIIDGSLTALVIYLLMLIGIGMACIWVREDVIHFLTETVFNTKSLGLILGVYVPLISIGVVVVPSILVIIFLYLKYYIELPRLRKRLAIVNEESEKEHKIEKAEHARNYKNAVDRHNKLVEQQKAANAKVKNEIDTWNARKKALHELGENVATVLVKLYSPFIAVSDWDNLDYIIYLIESNRCDNIKEALNYIDNQERFDELLDTIGNVTTAIRSSISSAMDAIGNNVLSSVGNLTNEIDKYNRSIDCQTDIINEQNRILGELKDTRTVENKLLKNIDEDMKKINY